MSNSTSVSQSNAISSVTTSCNSTVNLNSIATNNTQLNSINDVTENTNTLNQQQQQQQPQQLVDEFLAEILEDIPPSIAETHNISNVSLKRKKRKQHELHKKEAVSSSLSQAHTEYVSNSTLQIKIIQFALLSFLSLSHFE
jgi:hypothetical protein